MKEMSLELKCCQFIQPWSATIKVTNITNWAEKVGYLYFRAEVDSQQEAVERAKKEVTRLHSFVKDLVFEKDTNEVSSETTNKYSPFQDLKNLKHNLPR